MLMRARPTCSRAFSTATCLQSYIGSAPIPLSSEVTLSDISAVSTTPRTLLISGPMGKNTVTVPPYMNLVKAQSTAGSTIVLSVLNHKIKEQRSMWGTTRALLSNAIIGVTEGFTVSIKFVGVGYRAAVDGQSIVLRVGFSKPVVLQIPEGITASCPQPTALILSGRDKQGLTQFAAVIRSYRKPEPYKGKGIFVNNETIKIKSPAGKK